MRGFPNRMPYHDFKMRYACLGTAEIASSSDNKTSVYALMDKIAFDRERYRLGHTLVFFRAGALAGVLTTEIKLIYVNTLYACRS
jgi:myosin heavy subunit